MKSKGIILLLTIRIMRIKMKVQRGDVHEISWGRKANTAGIQDEKYI